MISSLANVAVFISGGGSNLQALIDATKCGLLAAKITLVVSSTPDAYGLKRAEKESIATFVYSRKDYGSIEEAAERLMVLLAEHHVDYIALAGYLKLLPTRVVRNYHNRIINIHPALLPKYGGKGMYGHHVHEAVIASGDSESGVTVHLVNEKYDEGQILEQIRVPVLPADTPDLLATRVLEQEHKLFPRVLDKLIKGKYNLSHG